MTQHGAPSEVWARRQAACMTRFAPMYVCWKDLMAAPRKGGQAAAGDRWSARYPVHALSSPRVMPKTIRSRLENWLDRGDARHFAARGAEIKELKALLRDEPPAVAVIHFATTALRLWPLLREAGVPMVVFLHGYDITQKLSQRRYVTALKQMLPTLAGVIPVARFMGQTAIRLGADPARVHVIPTGAPVREIPFVARSAAGPVRLIAVGRMVEKKSPESVLRAFAHALCTVPDLTLAWLGDGRLRADTERLAKELGVREALDLRGMVPPEQTLDALRDTDILVQHSVTAPDGDMEGTPTSISEAMASGLPVIATRHGGIVDQVIEGKTGLLADEYDWRGMGEAIIALARDGPRRLAMGAAGRAHAEATLDVERLTALIEDVMLAAIGTGKR